VGTRSQRSTALLLGWSAYCLLLSACGAAAAGSETPAPAPRESASVDTRDASGGEESEAVAEETPKAGPCEDHTCSTCGTGVCPNGWYCDESASGGPACGWLPRCAQKASCGCLTGKLGASCKCSEQNGGLHVTCK